MMDCGEALSSEGSNHLDSLLALADWPVYGGSKAENDRGIFSTPKSGALRVVTDVKGGRYASVSRDCPEGPVQAGAAI